MKRTVSATIPDGAVGVWHIPSQTIYVPLYAPKPGKSVQSIVDDKHSAAYQKWGAGHVIVDHANSKHGAARWKVNELKLNDKAYLFFPDEIRRYTCTALYRVKVGSSYKHGNIAIWPQTSADILCACCTEEGPRENYMAYFRFDGKEQEE